MPETRYIELFQRGRLVGKEPYQVSDTELAAEARARIRSSALARLKVLRAKPVSTWDNADIREAVISVINVLDLEA